MAVTDQGGVYLQWVNTIVQLDPVAHGGAMDEIREVLVEIAAQTCPAKQTIGTDSLACDWKPNHPQNFHHDPRGVYWKGPEE